MLTPELCVAGVSLAHHTAWHLLPGGPLPPLRSVLSFLFPETAPTSAYSSPARSLGDTGITPLSPSHIVVRRVYMRVAVRSLPCLSGSVGMRRLSSPSHSWVEMAWSQYQPSEPSRLLVPLWARVAGAVGASGLGGSNGQAGGGSPEGTGPSRIMHGYGSSRQGPGIWSPAARPDPRSCMGIAGRAPGQWLQVCTEPGGE